MGWARGPCWVARGCYCDEFFFGLTTDRCALPRVDDSNRAEYTSRGMVQFKPYADRPHLSMRHYEVPADLIDDASELVTRARRSMVVAMKVPKARAEVKRRRKKHRSP